MRSSQDQIASGGPHAPVTALIPSARTSVESSGRLLGAPASHTDSEVASGKPGVSHGQLVRYLLALGAALVVWVIVYRALPALSVWLTYDVLGLPVTGRLGSAVAFFLYDAPKVLMLLALVVFGVGIVRTFFTPAAPGDSWPGRRESAGNVLAAGLGIVTPFCSCSAVPLFIGFVTPGVPLGVTFSFLISAPMVNEVALVLLYGLFGWKVAAHLRRHRARSSPSWPAG